MARGARDAGAVFIDTHALVSVANTTDEHHAQTRRLLEAVAHNRIPAFTSDWVLAEFLSACAKRALRSAAASITAELRSSGLTTVIEANRGTWDRAFQLFRARGDKEWSLIDCTTIILCGEHHVGRVLTHDHHFMQAGLKIMIP